MSVDYKTQREVDRELFIEEVRSDVKNIVEGYYSGESNIAHILDLLEEQGMYKRDRNDVEGQLVGNNESSDDIIDYIMDRVDLEPITE
jgi:hypothetical protein